jgi:internalin A
LNSVLFPPGTLSADLAPFAGNPSLKMVHLPDTVSDEGLRILVTFPALEMVDLSSCSNLTEAGFRELAKSRTIRTLVLPQRMTDEGMKQLAGLASLQRIYLSNTEVSDQGIAALKDHASLEELFLSRSVTNACIPALAAMPALRNLELRTDKITAEGLGGLNASRSLRALNLNRLNVDESGIKALGKLTQLEQLSIYNPGLSPAQVETLKAALPKCNINTN